MSLVLSESAAGCLVLLFCFPLWREAKHGFFKVTGAVILALAFGAWGAMAAGYRSGGGSPSPAVPMAAALSLATIIWLSLLFTPWENAGRWIGVASVPLSIAVLWALSASAGGSRIGGFLQLLAGGAYLGAVLCGMLLGHWYLTDRGLGRGPIDRYSTALIVGVVLEAIAVIGAGFGPTKGSQSFNPLITAAGLSTWVSLGMLLTSAVIAVLIKLALKGKRAAAVQSATGFFYLAVITGFAGELATKVRFLP
jgi:hypothetical protein